MIDINFTDDGIRTTDLWLLETTALPTEPQPLYPYLVTFLGLIVLTKAACFDLLRFVMKDFLSA